MPGLPGSRNLVTGLPPAAGTGVRSIAMKRISSLLNPSLIGTSNTP
jgi:hypothetical protein